MAQNTRGTVKLTVVALLSALTLIPASAAAQLNVHLDWAQELADNLPAANNVYDTSPFYVTWPGVNGATKYSNRTLCSNFLTAVLRQSYGWTTNHFSSWLGSTSPNAEMYFDAILAEDGFEMIHTIQDIDGGDIVALQYESDNPTSGHVGIAEGPASPRGATEPIVPNTQQWEMWIIDSTRNGHGWTDSRYQNGSWAQGAGRGMIRFYTDAQGFIVGHTWTTTSSAYYSTALRDIVVGRLL